MWYLPILFNLFIFKDSLVTGEKPWTGPYFPHSPGDGTPNTQNTNIISDSGIPSPFKTEKGWTMPWFPNQPGKEDLHIQGREHYNPPDTEQSINSNSISNNETSVNKAMGLVNPECDNGKDNITIDYDPKYPAHQLRPICLDKRDDYKSNATLEALVKDYQIPPQYSALHKCMNENITYDYNIPTFGTHRSVWPVYGEYNYVPRQRWLHNLEHGAIVALYHPCASMDQISKLKKLIKGCLYRHIITPYEQLDAIRPFAVVAWGKSIEMPYVNPTQIIAFIRMNALQAPEKISRDGQYNIDLIQNAKVVSDIDDHALCPNM